MTRGIARRAAITEMQDLGALIDSLKSDEALGLGTLRADLPDQVEIVTKRYLDKSNGVARPDVIARTGGNIVFRPGQPALALLDFDTKRMPPQVAAKLAEFPDFWNAIVSVCPELEIVARVMRRSTSAGLFRTDTREELPGSDGMHVFVAVKDGADVERYLKVLHARCFLSGLGWLMVSAGGQVLERSIVDRVVGLPERLVFEGPPILDPPLAQDAASCRPMSIDGIVLDTLAACPPLSIVEQASFREARAKEESRLAPEVAKAKAEFVARQSGRLVARTGMELSRARRIVERQCSGVLLPDIVLPFDEAEFAESTVADVIADPDRFEGATLADPLEGVDYGRCKACIMRRKDGTPWIHSFAHGRTTYELRYDFAAALAALQQGAPDAAAKRFVNLVLSGDLAADEVEQLRDLAAQRADVGKRPLDRMLKAARQEQLARQAEEERNRRASERRDPRPQIPAPFRDAPWLEQMDVLNEVLGAVNDPEPPARDIDGVYVKVRVRRAIKMHTLTSDGSNAEETANTRLPAPEQPLLTRLSEAQLAEEIERYIDYIDREGRSVHLGIAFVHHFHTRPDDDALPLAAAIATLPIVLGDGTLLAGQGLDRERGIVFRIPKDLLAILPRRKDCTPKLIRAAMRFLMNEWLCDVRNQPGWQVHPDRCRADNNRAFATPGPADVLGDGGQAGWRQNDGHHNVADGDHGRATGGRCMVPERRRAP